MNELDQKDYWYPGKIKTCKNLCTKSMESCPLVISHILAKFHPERATYTTLHNHFNLLNGLSKSAQTFTVGFVKLLSTHPIHIVVWGNFPFNHSSNGIQLTDWILWNGKFYYRDVIKMTITQAKGEGNGHLYHIEVIDLPFHRIPFVSCFISLIYNKKKKTFIENLQANLG